MTLSFRRTLMAYLSASVVRVEPRKTSSRSHGMRPHSSGLSPAGSAALDGDVPPTSRTRAGECCSGWDRGLRLRWAIRATDQRSLLRSNTVKWPWRRRSELPQPVSGDPNALARLETLKLRTNAGFTWLERFGVVWTVLLFIGAVLRLGESGPAWALVLVVWMCLVTTTAIGLIFVLSHRMQRRSRYTYALEHLHAAHHLLRDGASALLLRDARVEDVVPLLSRTMTATAEAFTLITGARCRACIKQVHYPTGSSGDPSPVHNAETLRPLQVSTVCRDEATGPQPTDDSPAHVDQNTDFEVLFLQRDKFRWFMSNDLTRMPGYKNSSWELGIPKTYTSTCVWPIQKMGAGADNTHDVLGFLCVDSQVPGIFDKRFDFHVGAAIADGLYAVLKLIHRQRQGISFSVPPTPDQAAL